MLLLLLVGLFFFVRSPWGQNVIVQKAVRFVAEKTQTKVSLDRLFVSFRGDIYLEGLFLEDTDGDTLVYSQSLETGLKFLPLIREGAIDISRLDLQGLRAKVTVDSVTGKFNFDFLIDAFASQDTVAKVVEPGPLPQISLGPVDLRDVQIRYTDGLSGMDLSAKWERIQLNAENLDLNRMSFAINSARIVKADVSFVQNFASASPTDSSLSGSAALPLLALDKLDIQESRFLYQSVPDGVLAKVALGSLSMSLPEADLESQKILLKSLALANAEVLVELESSSVSPTKVAQQETEPFAWPAWWLEAGSIELSNNNIKFRTGTRTSTAGIFDPDNLEISDLNLSLDNLYLKDEQFRGRIGEFSFRERSGLALNQLSLQLAVDNQKVQVSNLVAATNTSSLAGDLKLGFSTLADFLEQPEEASVDLSLRTLLTNASEALYFVPELRNDPYFMEVMNNGLQASGVLRGNSRQLSIPRLDAAYGKETSIHVSSLALMQWMQPERILIRAPEFSFRTKGRVLEPFLADLEYQLPESISLVGSLSGDINQATARIELETSDGDISFDGSLAQGNFYEVESAIQMREFDLGKIMEIPSLSPLSLETRISGKGSNLYDLEGMVEVAFSKLLYADKDFSDVQVKMEAKDTLAQLSLSLAEEFLDVDLLTKVWFDTLNPRLDLAMDLRSLNLRAFEIVGHDVDMKLQLHGHMEGSLDNLRLGIATSEGSFQTPEKSYPMGDVRIQAQMDSVQMQVEILSDFLWGTLGAEGSLTGFASSLNSYLRHQILGEPYRPDSLDLKAQAKLDFRSTPFMDQLLVPDLEGMDTLHVDFTYDALNSELNASVGLLWAKYLDARLDSFDIEIVGEREVLTVDLGFKRLEYSPVSMDLTRLDAEFSNGQGQVAFFSNQGDSVFNQLASKVAFVGDTLIVNVLPDNLIFSMEKWQTPADNELVYAPGYLEIKNFNFFNERQKVGLVSNNPGIEAAHVSLDFENFDLNTLIGFLNPDQPLARGIVNGEITAITPFQELGLLADMNIEGFEVMSLPLGRLDLGAKARSLKSYDLNLALKEGKVDLDVLGSLTSDTVSTHMDLQVSLNALQVSLLEILSDSAIREGKGVITGDIKLDGTIQDPRYRGELRFKDVGFLVSELNTRFSMEQELIRIDNAGFRLDDFTIKDEVGDAFVIAGNISTENPTNPALDLTLKTKDFQVMNSTRKDSDLFFGKATVDLDMNIGGTVDLPVINMQLRVNDGTEISFIVPEDQVDMVERTGIVIFVNQKDPYDLLYKREGDFKTRGLTGYDVHANLKVDPKTVFNLIVDERTGDNLRIQGEADLSMIMNPNGDISLSGRYQVGSGHYEMNLFGLVNRRFELAEGSSVVWTGEPTSAKLNLRAIYNVRTSAAELMQAQLSGTTNDTRSQFRQVLPFMVYLNIDGEMLKPEISFELDMAENERGAFGGSVYGMIQQINEKDDELTKQVFSLLVLNQFFPVVGNDGSGGGSVNLARSSVSQVLSSQLNALSDRLFGDSGFSVDFNLDSYTDFQSGTGEDRTQLSVAAKQSLMDDRLVISVGGQMDVEGGNQHVNQAEGLFGDVSLEYLLDPRGKWRAKAYRKNTFESVIDGQLIVTGVSFIFNRDFNEFMELWRKSAQEVLQEEEEKKRKEKRKERKKQKKEKQ